MKIRPVGVEFFHADRRTDRHNEAKLILSFRNFVNAPTNCLTTREALHNETHAQNKYAYRHYVYENPPPRTR